MKYSARAFLTGRVYLPELRKSGFSYRLDDAVNIRASYASVSRLCAP